MPACAQLTLGVDVREVAAVWSLACLATATGGAAGAGGRRCAWQPGTPRSRLVRAAVWPKSGHAGCCGRSGPARSEGALRHGSALGPPAKRGPCLKPFLQASAMQSARHPHHLTRQAFLLKPLTLQTLCHWLPSTSVDGGMWETIKHVPHGFALKLDCCWSHWRRNTSACGVKRSRRPLWLPVGALRHVEPVHHVWHPTQVGQAFAGSNEGFTAHAVLRTAPPLLCNSKFRDVPGCLPWHFYSRLVRLLQYRLFS